jgi:hypothetical protein
MGTAINPQRALMQDVGPGISVHIPALSPVPVAHVYWKIPNTLQGEALSPEHPSGGGSESY